MNKFNNGDKVTTNPEYNDKNYFWNIHKGTIMTISKKEKLTINDEEHYHVEENDVLWYWDHLIKYNEPFEFDINDFVIE